MQFSVRAWQFARRIGIGHMSAGNGCWFPSAVVGLVAPQQGVPGGPGTADDRVCGRCLSTQRRHPHCCTCGARWVDQP